MWRSIELSGLPRPARLRAFPPGLTRHASNSPSSSKTDGASNLNLRNVSKALPRTKKPSLAQESVEGLTRLRNDRADYLQALELKKQSSSRPGPSKTASSSSSKLPSLGNPRSFHATRTGKAQVEQEKLEPRQTKPSGNDGPRRNPVGVQMLSSSLHKQLFPGPSLPKSPKHLVNLSRNHLKANGLDPDKAAILDQVILNMPPLAGDNIRQHFMSIGSEVAEPYLSMAKEFVHTDLPPMPAKWVTDRPGWTRYDQDGSHAEVEDLGDEKMISFDVETLWKLSPYPVMAAAASKDAWYTWLSPKIFEDPPRTQPDPAPRWDKTPAQQHPHVLISLFPKDSKSPRVVVGHNVGYDRARVKDEYDLQGTSTKWLDTLSLHMATTGITSVQRPSWTAHQNKKKRNKELRDIVEDLAEESKDEGILDSIQEDDVDKAARRWEDVTAMNSLVEVASLHCEIKVDKSTRDRFSDEEITHASQLRPELEELIQYNADDVRITHQVFEKVFPLFLGSCPHPASFAGILPMGSSFLPVNESWQDYLRSSEEKYNEMTEGVKKGLKVLAEKVRRLGPNDDDPWLSQLDWTPKKARWSDETISFTAESAMSSSSTTDEQVKRETASWYAGILQNPSSLFTTKSQNQLLPLLLRLSYKGHPIVWLHDEFWCFRVPHSEMADFYEDHGSPVQLSKFDTRLGSCLDDSELFRVAKVDKNRVGKILGKPMRSLVKEGVITSPYPDILEKVFEGNLETLEEDFLHCAKDLLAMGQKNTWGMQLDWTSSAAVPTKITSGSKAVGAGAHGQWPKWYHDLTLPASKLPPGELDLTQKKSVAPLLLRLQWHGYPLVYDQKAKWVFRVPREEVDNDDFHLPSGHPIDLVNAKDSLNTTDFLYYRLPHKDGDGKNVGSPFAKAFVNSFENGDLACASGPSHDSEDEIRTIASQATNMNVLCSYWSSSRERIMDQMVVYKTPSDGMILPQVITMGTVTRRAVESTWLTASNAKKNRVGSELKAMVRAPPGYAIVGADVDSEELWISSVMGDSQFGMHGATAIGWMTLEGTKAAGTDLHSKTAAILGTSRDAAKVFNYSRIYGAGQKHAVQLLMQGDPTLSKEKAAKKAADLYSATKGLKVRRPNSLPPAAIPSLWHGGSESYLFNTLEAIAISDRPTTPALGCGVTKALSKSYLEEGSAYLPSRINWVVQSSGVDYLHLLIVSMEYLIKRYGIEARYLISVHDEVRYLAKEEDRYRTALALQIANAWTRALFCYNLGMDDVPQGVTFFSAVDIDHVLRKEVFMSCETPSHASPIPPGESLDITQLLALTNGGELSSIPVDQPIPAPIQDAGAPVSLVENIASPSHNRFLTAQADRSPVAAKKWINSQPSLKDADGVALPVEKNERQHVVKKTLASDPAHFRRSTVFSDQTKKRASPHKTSLRSSEKASGTKAKTT